MRRPGLRSNPPRTVRVEIDRHVYFIPEMWLVGATMHRTIPEAIQLWHEQELMEAAHRQQQLYRRRFARKAASCAR